MKLTGFWNKHPVWEAAGEPTGGTPAPEPVASDPDPAAASAEPDFGWIPEGYKGEDGSYEFERFSTEIQDLLAEKAQRDEQAALIPENGEYNFALPDEIDFGEMKLPEGFKVELDTDNEALKPLFGEMGELLKDLGAPGEASGKVMSLLAKYEAVRHSEAFTALNAEYEKLGSNTAMRQARVNAVETKLKSRLSDEKHVNAIMASARSYDAIRGLESLLASGGPGPSVPQSPSGQDLASIPPGERLKIINKREAENY